MDNKENMQIIFKKEYQDSKIKKIYDWSGAYTFYGISWVAQHLANIGDYVMRISDRDSIIANPIFNISSIVKDFGEIIASECREEGQTIANRINNEYKVKSDVINNIPNVEVTGDNIISDTINVDQ